MNTTTERQTTISVSSLPPPEPPLDLRSIASSLEAIHYRLSAIADRVTQIYGEPLSAEKANKPQPAGEVPILFGLVDDLDSEVARIQAYVDRM